MQPLTPDQYHELLRIVCPYCALDIPDHYSFSKHTHVIPETDFKAECWAQRIRGKVPIEKIRESN